MRIQKHLGSAAGDGIQVWDHRRSALNHSGNETRRLIRQDISVWQSRQQSFGRRIIQPLCLVRCSSKCCERAVLGQNLLLDLTLFRRQVVTQTKKQ